jgi:DNA-nicking Smr family endonuclease
MSLAEPSDAELSEADHLEFRRPGLQPALWRRLRRGEFRIEATLDLHGQTVDESRQRLALFIQRGVRGGLKCVRVVHGKGYRSPGLAPVLKPRVAYWLSHLAEVTAFISAQPADGGTGALYVLLKRHPHS